MSDTLPLQRIVVCLDCHPHRVLAIHADLPASCYWNNEQHTNAAILDVPYAGMDLGEVATLFAAEIEAL